VLRLAASAALWLGLGAVLFWRARRVAHERLVWRQLALGTGVVATGGALSCVLALVPATRDAALLPLCVTAIGAFPVLYGALVRWNRVNANATDPNDMFSGIASILCWIGGLVIGVTQVHGHLAALPWWRLYAVLGLTAVVVILTAMLLTVAFLTGMNRDPRVWLIWTAFALPLAVLALNLASTGAAAAWATVAVPLATLSMCLAATLSARPIPPQRSSPTVSTVGAFMSVVLSTVVLVLGALVHAPTAVIVCGGLAVLLASTRMLINVRDLAQLDVTRRQALTDELTGLPNRRAFLERLDQQASAGAPFVLALLDLDRFKQVNDRLGHAAGDELLRQVSRRLASALRPEDMLGRLGGDEFAVVAAVEDGADPETAALSLGRRLHGRLADPVQLGDESVPASLSVGLTTATGRQSTSDDRHRPERLLVEADAAMYAAKAARSGVVVGGQLPPVPTPRHERIVSRR
jgi:diguanylate cyclase (GGDEF)-like protein